MVLILNPLGTTEIQDKELIELVFNKNSGVKDKVDNIGGRMGKFECLAIVDHRENEKIEVTARYSNSDLVNLCFIPYDKLSEYNMIFNARDIEALKKIEENKKINS
jgi:hypothetical protein